jgi:hypothetical protein
MAWPVVPATAAEAAPGCAGLPAWLRPKNPGRIRLTVPWRTLTGIGPEPGELSWVGPVTPAQARELAVAAAADPSVTWRIIVTDDDGHAIAVTALRTGRASGARAGARTAAGVPGLLNEVTITIKQSLVGDLESGGKAREWTERALAGLGIGGASFARADFAELTDLLAKVVGAANLAAAEAAERAARDAKAGGCAHTMEAAGYRVPDRLRRWVSIRDRTCRNPICRQPALRCDQDHTIAYHRGGRTCSCNLSGLCRAHHELKQLPGWHLSQDARGCFTWTTPAGLSYRREPHCYAV